MTGTLVVGVDGSTSSIEALRWAGRSAGPLGLTIEVVMSWEYPTAYGLSMVPAVNWQDDCVRLLATSVTTAFGPKVPEGLVQVVREGHPAKVLLDASRDAELLVVGTRGRGGFAGLLLGSVSSVCAEHGVCPVVVVHDREERS
jgi:nucleotide-binding universal stress UspA family protein